MAAQQVLGNPPEEVLAQAEHARRAAFQQAVQWLVAWQCQQLGHQVEHQGLAGKDPAAQGVVRRDQLAQAEWQAPADAQRRAETGRTPTQGLFDVVVAQRAAGFLPVLQAAQQGQLADVVQQSRRVAQLMIQAQLGGQPVGQLGAALGLFAHLAGQLGQAWVLQLCIALDGHAQSRGPRRCAAGPG